MRTLVIIMSPYIPLTLWHYNSICVHGYYSIIQLYKLSSLYMLLT